MAVYGQTYKRYGGELTPERTRFLILPRYAYESVFKSRLFVSFFVLCFVVPFAGLILIYLHHNLSALRLLQLPAEELKQFLPINASFFWRGLWMQGALSFVMALFVGPALVSPDLRNNGLPLYLSRPFSRTEYVLGKMSVLLILISAITWVPGLLLFLFQGYLEGAGWLGRNLDIAFAILAGSWAWMIFLSLFTLAVSAWVKWKPVARATMMIFFFVMIGVAKSIEEALDAWWGMLLSSWHVIASIWGGLFGQAPEDGLPPVWAAWCALIFGCLLFLLVLYRRIRAYEVVR